jgi:hypothetical protein
LALMRADQESQRILGLGSATHVVAVDAKRERRIGVAELVHDRARIDTERDQQRRERVAQLVGREPPGKGTSPASSSSWLARSTVLAKTRSRMLSSLRRLPALVPHRA